MSASITASSDVSPSAPADSGATLDVRGLVAYVALACGLAWLLALALFLSGHRMKGVEGFVVAALSMLMPSVATFIVTRWVSPLRPLARRTGLGLGVRWKRFWVLAWLGTPVVVLAALGLSVLLGRYPLDLGLSGLMAQLPHTEKLAPVIEKMTAHPLRFLALTVGQAVVMAPLINAPFILGEEWGWRGYLLPRLLPLGQWRALVLSGAIWGVWHAPLILLGHNYPQHRVAGVFFMVVFCVLTGILIGWTRLATGSVWPAVIIHGSLNGVAPLAGVLNRAGTTVDMAEVGLLGWPGWLLMAALIGVLVLTRRLPVRDAPDVVGR